MVECSGERVGRWPVLSTANLLERQRLHRLIDDDPTPITLVCAPAGAGKTTLLAGWAATAAAAGAVVAWHTVDTRGSSASAVWRGVLAALKATGAFSITSPIHTMVLPRHETTGFLDALVRELERLPAPIWLVIDDFHRSTTGGAGRFLDLLVQRASSHLRIIISTRSDPGFGVSRLRIEGRLKDIRADDLAFTDDEVGQVFAQQGLELSFEAISSLRQRTEGWAAGVRISALAMQGTDDPIAFVDRFSGDDHAVADYLVAEVLASLEDRDRELLLSTSICGRFSTDLARELTGRDDVASLLDRLVRENIFTTRVGRGRDEYRYHELFRTYLVAELRRTQPEREGQLHRVAGAWFAANGEQQHAVRHLVAVGDRDGLEAYARSNGLDLLFSGGSSALSAVIGMEEGARADPAPHLDLVVAAAATELGDVDLVRQRLGRLAAIVQEDRRLRPFSSAVTILAGRCPAAIEVALERLDHQMPRDEDVHLSLLALQARGMGRLEAGRYGEARTDLQRGVALASRAGHGAVVQTCRSFLAAADAYLGHVVDARAGAQKVLSELNADSYGAASAVANAHAVTAGSALLEGDEAAASSHAAEAVASLQAATRPGVELAVHSVVAVQAMRTPAGWEALRCLRTAFEQLRGLSHAPATVALHAPDIVRACLEVGERVWAQEFVELAGAAVVERGEAGLLRSLILRDAGKPDAARRCLQPVLSDEESCHLPATEARSYLLAAGLEQHRGNGAAAHALLAIALERCESMGVTRWPLDDEVVCGMLIEGAGRGGRSEGFARRLRAAMRERSAGPSATVGHLTPAEMAVLRELPSLLSLGEIATMRAVSVNTVKTHLRSIYRKLSVTSRREAVDRARHRGLI